MDEALNKNSFTDWLRLFLYQRKKTAKLEKKQLTSDSGNFETKI